MLNGLFYTDISRVAVSMNYEISQLYAYPFSYPQILSGYP